MHVHRTRTLSAAPGGPAVTSGQPASLEDRDSPMPPLTRRAARALGQDGSRSSVAAPRGALSDAAGAPAAREFPSVLLAGRRGGDEQIDDRGARVERVSDRRPIRERQRCPQFTFALRDQYWIRRYWCRVQRGEPPKGGCVGFRCPADREREVNAR